MLHAGGKMAWDKSGGMKGTGLPGGKGVFEVLGDRCTNEMHVGGPKRFPVGKRCCVVKVVGGVSLGWAETNL